ncbi:hypothetical protein K2173_008969 [Erythroxylum novogranatense]|uniref:Pectinesterase inhibitor domain-containing protein n=1 Tax=Erythroxylum novogranatense TaxID=1862640 RepID=A0AAV8TSF5_9ROSI|nr:hypothetical protein K2173_008969 [Erythroxylum novogranatense]
MANSLFLSLICAFLLLLLIVVPVSATATITPHNKLVSKVCHQTSDYSFCINSLFSDHRTPEADEYTLAYISVGLAYLNATATRGYVNKLLRRTSSYRRLMKCSRDYVKAVSALETAYNDLNSETFFELADLANDAAHAADNCEVSVQGIRPPPLGKRNRDLKGLCQICAVVAKLFTGSD